MTELETPRLRMRPFDWNDFEREVAIYADPEVTKYLPRGPVRPDELYDRVQRVLTHFIAHWTDHGFGVWALVDRATGDLVGHCGLQHLPVEVRGAAEGEPSQKNPKMTDREKRNPEGADVEVLYLLERAQWGRGLAAEAAHAALGHGFGRVGLERIVAVTRPEHVASRRVMEKLGMLYEGEVDIYGLHAVRYALSRGEFLPER